MHAVKDFGNFKPESRYTILREPLVRGRLRPRETLHYHQSKDSTIVLVLLLWEVL